MYGRKFRKGQRVLITHRDYRNLAGTIDIYYRPYGYRILFDSPVFLRPLGAITQYVWMQAKYLILDGPHEAVPNSGTASSIPEPEVTPEVHQMNRDELRAALPELSDRELDAFIKRLEWVVYARNTQNLFVEFETAQDEANQVVAKKTKKSIEPVTSSSE